jgi:uncharacterized membrane protein
MEADLLDSKLREKLGALLRLGVGASGLFLAAGLGLSLLGSADAGRRALTGGITLMVATPVVRVALIALDFASRREWRFFAASAAVLGLLLLGVFLGAGH